MPDRRAALGVRGVPHQLAVRRVAADRVLGVREHEAGVGCDRRAPPDRADVAAEHLAIGVRHDQALAPAGRIGRVLLDRRDPAVAGVDTSRPAPERRTGILPKSSL